MMTYEDNMSIICVFFVQMSQKNPEIQTKPSNFWHQLLLPYKNGSDSNGDFGGWELAFL